MKKDITLRDVNNILEGARSLSLSYGTNESTVNSWMNHQKLVGDYAFKIGKAINEAQDKQLVNTAKIKKMGYLHDIGKVNYSAKKNSCNSVINHAIDGYRILKKMNLPEEYCGICIKHSFLNNDIECLANVRDYVLQSVDGYEFVKEYIKQPYTLEDKIINMCDLMCKDVFMGLDDRMQDLLTRNGVHLHTEYHIAEANKLRKYLNNLAKTNIENL